MERAATIGRLDGKQSGGGHERRLFYDKCGRYLFIAAAFLMTIIIFSIIFFVGKQGLMTFAEVSPLEFFFSASWDPSLGKFGALSFIVGSLVTTILSVLIGAPLGLLGAIFLAKVAPSWLKNIMRPATDIYVAIPSVVYGYIGLTLLVPYLRDALGATTGFGVLAASLVLAIMIMPTILSISTDALNAVSKPLEAAICARKPDVVMACGPTPMLAAVQALCETYGVPCQLSLEERMGCGIGACLGCNVKIMQPDGGWRYKRVCKDGPVFDAKEVCLRG